MADITIKHKRTGPIGQNNGKQLYQVNLDPPTKYIEKGEYDTSSKIHFNRMSPEQNHGFEVKLFDESGSLIDSGQVTNGALVSLDMPPVGDYSYKVYYPWDGSNVEVLPLDPVIIIEPPRNKLMTYALVGGVIGVALASLCFLVIPRLI